MLISFQKVIPKGDSLDVVKILQGEGCCWRRFGTMINDAKTILNSLQEWQACHTKRMANTSANLLAKYGFTDNEYHIWWGQLSLLYSSSCNI
jgi:hypothetical protein